MFYCRQVLFWILVFGIYSCGPQEVREHSRSFYLPVNLEALKVEFSDYEKLYFYKHYRRIAQGGFPGGKGDKFEYLYMRSLYHLKEWDNLLHSQKYLNTKSNFYPYLVVNQIEALLAQDHYQLAYDTFLQMEELLEKHAFPEEVGDLFERILAELGLEGESVSPGRYFYYRFLKSKEIKDLAKALKEKDKGALAQVNAKNFTKVLTKEEWRGLVSWVETRDTSLAWQIYQLLGERTQAGNVLFNRKNYARALTFLPSGSSFAVLSRLALGRGTLEDEKAAEDNPAAFSYLIKQYKKQNNYPKIVALYGKFYQSGHLREIFLSMLEAGALKPLEELLEILSKKGKSLDEQEYLMTLYWRGVISGNKENLKELITRYPYSFYGLMALEEWGDEKRWVEPWKEIFESNVKAADKLLKGWETRIFEREQEPALFLLKIGETTRGFALLRKQLGDLSPYHLELVRFFKAVGRTDLVIHFGRQVYESLAQVCGNRLFYVNLFQEIFPFKFRNLIDKVATEYDLSSDLIAAMVRQESRFDVMALSRVGASGLFQVMPATAAPILKALAKKEQIISLDLFDPWTNLLVGGDFLNWLLKRVYKDTPEPYQKILAIASYNAGPRRIKKHYEDFPAKKHPAFFIESIPLSETRVYTKVVLIYEKVYGFLKMFQEDPSAQK